MVGRYYCSTSSGSTYSVKPRKARFRQVKRKNKESNRPCFKTFAVYILKSQEQSLQNKPDSYLIMNKVIFSNSSVIILSVKFCYLKINEFYSLKHFIKLTTILDLARPTFCYLDVRCSIDRGNTKVTWIWNLLNLVFLFLTILEISFPFFSPYFSLFSWFIKCMISYKLSESQLASLSLDILIVPPSLGCWDNSVRIKSPKSCEVPSTKLVIE